MALFRWKLVRLLAEGGNFGSVVSSFLRSMFLVMGGVARLWPSVVVWGTIKQIGFLRAFLRRFLLVSFR